MAVPVGTRSRPELLFTVAANNNLFRPFGYDVTPDGSRFLLIRSEATGAGPLPMTVVENFFTELKRRAPARPGA